MKKLLIVLLVLAVIAGAGVFLLLGSLGGIVKSAVEGVGSEATQSQVTLGDVSVSATDGKGELRDLVIGNPDGFATAHAMRFGIVRVVVDTTTLSSDTIVVKEVVIERPQITYEVGTGRTNIGTIQENVEAFAQRLGAGGSGDSGGGDGGGGSDDGGKRVVIEDVYVRGGRVAVSATFLGGNELGVDLPEIHLEDLGKADGGASPGEVAAEILGAITDAVLGSVATLNLDSLRDGVEGVIDQGKKAVEGALDGLLGR